MNKHDIKPEEMHELDKKHGEDWALHAKDKKKKVAKKMQSLEELNKDLPRKVVTKKQHEKIMKEQGTEKYKHNWK